jgi:hypothetical protein
MERQNRGGAQRLRVAGLPDSLPMEVKNERKATMDGLWEHATEALPR